MKNEDVKMPVQKPQAPTPEQVQKANAALATALKIARQMAKNRENNRNN